MEANSCSSNFPQSKGLVFGLLLVIAGLLFLSFNFGWIDAAWRPILFSWPMIFIVMCYPYHRNWSLAMKTDR